MMLFFKVRVFRIRRGDNPSDAALYACFMCLVKFIEPVGMAQFVWNRKILGKQPRLIEYKGAR